MTLFIQDSERIKVSIYQKHEEFFLTHISLCIYKCWQWNTENKINIKFNKPSRKHYLHVRSGKQVSSTSARILGQKYTKLYTSRSMIHGLNCENFDRVKLSRLKYRQLQSNKYFEPVFELVGVDIFRDGLLDLQNTDAMNIMFQSLFSVAPSSASRLLL